MLIWLIISNYQLFYIVVLRENNLVSYSIYRENAKIMECFTTAFNNNVRWNVYEYNNYVKKKTNLPLVCHRWTLKLYTLKYVNTVANNKCYKTSYIYDLY